MQGLQVLQLLLLFIVAALPLNGSVAMDGARSPQALGKRSHQGMMHGAGAGKSVELLSIVDDAHRSYGSDLPAFTHDYGELMMSAMVERGDEGVDDMHLTMFLMGHKVLVDNFPFESLSTDQHILMEWNQAIRKWNPSRNITYNPSNYLCVIRNNIGTDGSASAYIAPAVWVPATDINGGKLLGNIEVLRCKIKFGHSKSKTKSKWLKSTFSNSEESLYVDLVNKRRHNKNSQVRIHRRLTTDTSINSNTNSNSNSNSSSSRGNKSSQSHSHSHDPRALLLSFSVPWRTRTKGYGLSFDSSISSLPNTTSNRYSTLDLWGGFDTRQRQSQQPQQLKQQAPPSVAVCSGRLRPRNSFRPEVAAPMLVEFLESLFSLGVSHAFLSVLLDRKSVHMQRYILSIEPFVKAGLVSVFSAASFDFPRPHSSTSSPDSTTSSHGHYDDAAGFLGIHLHERYAEWIFLNQCLYFSKGMFDYVLMMEPTDFIISPKALFNLPAFLQERIATSSHNQINSPTSLSYISGGNFSSAGFAFYFSAVGMCDPPDAFGTWGPADQAWTTDFFGASAVVSRESSKMLFNYQVMVVPSKGTFLVTHNESSRRSHMARLHAQHANLPVSTSVLAPPASTTTSSPPPSNLHHIYTISDSHVIDVHIPFEVVGVYKYKGIFEGINDELHNLQSISNLTIQLSDEEKSTLQSYWANIRDRTRTRGYPTKAVELRKSVATKAKELQANGVFNDLADPPVGSLTMRPPFWQSCDVERFKNVLARVFHTSS